MISLPDLPSMLSFLDQPLDPTLREQIAAHVHDAVTSGLADLTHLIVVEENDTEEDFLHAAAFSPYWNPLSCTRFGEPGFSPIWCWADQLEGWGWVALHTVGNDGFAFIIIIPDKEGIDPMLRAMCRAFLPTA